MGLVAFVKFGSEKNIRSLLERGEIYLNFLDQFRRQSGNRERYDHLEGASSNKYMKNGTIEIRPINDPDWKKAKFVNAHFTEFHRAEKLYSYSLFAITKANLEEVEIYKIDQRMSAFGSHFLFIHKPGFFRDKILQYLDENDYGYSCDLVKYYDRKIDHSKLNFFNKISEYSHQKEYRILVCSKSNKPLKFEIGGLESVGQIFESNILNTFSLKL